MRGGQRDTGQCAGSTGRHFGAAEAVDVYIDTTESVLLVASAAGTLSGTLTTPPAAQPGKHYVTAIGRHTGSANWAAATSGVIIRGPIAAYGVVYASSSAVPLYRTACCISAHMDRTRTLSPLAVARPLSGHRNRRRCGVNRACKSNIETQISG